MSDDASGNYSLPAGYLAVTGETILASQHNPPLEDIATALSARMSKSGVAPMTGALQMGGQKITGLANGSADTDAATVAQLDNFKKFVESIKTANYTVVAADAGGMIVANSATALTFNLPTLATVIGKVFWFRNVNDGDLTLDGAGSELIGGETTLVLNKADSTLLFATASAWRAHTSRVIASQAQAEAGTSNGPYMSPLRTKQAIDALFSFPAGHLYGLTLSNAAGDLTNDIDIAAGRCRDDANTENMILASALTKRLDALWTVGTNQGGLDTGSPSNTTYHVFLIKRPDTGVVDVLFSTSPTTPTLPTNYTKSRRIGSFRRISAANARFVQVGDEFLYSVTPYTDATAQSVGTSASLISLTVPTGIKVQAILTGGIINTVTFCTLTLSSPDSPDVASTTSLATAITQNSTVYNGMGRQSIRTDTSGRVRARSDHASTDLNLTTWGWIDRRGQDA